MARVLSFKAGFAMSAEIKGVWHRFESHIEIGVEDGDDISVVKEKAWNTVITEVEKAVFDVTGIKAGG